MSSFTEGGIWDIACCITSFEILTVDSFVLLILFEVDFFPIQIR